MFDGFVLKVVSEFCERGSYFFFFMGFRIYFYLGLNFL